MKLKNEYNEMPQPFEGIDVIGMGTFGNKEYPTDAYDAYSEQYDLPNEPILYIHSFFPKEEYKGKGLTKKYLLKVLSDWANHRLDNKELINRIGKRSLNNFGGSNFFGTSSFYDEGEKFFNNLVENGFLEKINLNKKKEGRALNLFKITDKTKNINNENKNLSLRDDVVSIIRGFCNEYGKTLAAHPRIKRIENDALGILAEKIDKFLNYGDYRKIWSIINKFTNNDALFDDNNVILAETILSEIQ